MDIDVASQKGCNVNTHVQNHLKRDSVEAVELRSRSVIDEIIPFIEAGFSIHWLKPRSKAPDAGAGWSDLPSATVQSLSQAYRPGHNVGVRLGEPSNLISGGYLHALDIDIRIPDLADEAWDALREILPTVNIGSLPCVQSGSQGESRHLYFVSDIAFRSRKLAVSEGKHRSRDGVWHYDWEIELFGTGKQVAMPPSIHPSGNPYVWIRPFDWGALALGIGPFIDSADIEALGVAQTATFAFEMRKPLDFKPGVLERDLESLPHDKWNARDTWIMIGQALHHQYGGSDEGFDLWMKHSSKSEKSKKNNTREQLRRYRGFGRSRREPVTMATIRQWAQDARDADLLGQFDEEPEDGFEGGAETEDFEHLIGADSAVPAGAKPADDIEAALAGAMAQAVTGVGKAPALEWASLLDINEEGSCKATLHNVELILRNDARLVGLAQYNLFTCQIVQRSAPGSKRARKKSVKPTRQLAGDVWKVKDRINGDLWSDDRDFAIRSIIEAPRTQGGYAIKVSDRDLHAATLLAAHDHAFHPVREYLESTSWDGTPRVERLFVDYLGAKDASYARGVARNTMIGAVARIYEPGHKADHVVILEGLQGRRKSTFIRILAKHFFAELEGNWDDAKQMVEQMQGSWIMELPELSGFGKADVRSIKAFVSRQADKVRLAYAHRAAEFPRQCIFIGSTNDSIYLRDDTGGRRWWPIACDVETINTDKLATEVDQLWAEALSMYRNMRLAQPHGTLPLYLSDAEAGHEALRLQESRRGESAEDGYAAQISDWLERPFASGSIDADDSATYRNQTCLKEVWEKCLGGDARSYTNTIAGTLGRAMLNVPGWAKSDHKMRIDGFGNTRFYARGGDAGRLVRMGLGG